MTNEDVLREINEKLSLLIKVLILGQTSVNSQYASVGNLSDARSELDRIYRSLNTSDMGKEVKEL